MKLTILGSGTYQPELERRSAAYLVQTENQNICFDFGRSALEELMKVGVHVNQIDAIFITHWHADHINDLVSLIHITIAAPRDFGVPDTWPIRKNPLKIFGPKGTLANIQMIARMVLYDPNPELKNLEIKELTNEEVDLGNDIRVKSELTTHNQETTALCYRLEAEGKILAYSGDSVESEGLAKMIKNADLAVIEAAWPDEVEPKTHFTGTRAGKFAQENGVKKLVITHIAPLYLQKYDPKKDAEKYFQGKVIVAKDLLTIEI